MNEKTGLPEVPKGYFWRVTDYRNDWGNAEDALELRRKTWVGSKLVAQEDIGYPNEMNIRLKAEEIMRCFEWDRERDEDRARLQGDYPPKSLA